MRDAGVTVAGSLSPQRTKEFAKTVVDAGVDMFVIRGTTVSAEHVSGQAEPLNLKEFIYELDVPVIVGGCATYQAALHLMRTGAAGVLVGFGGGAAHTTRTVLGVAVPMASAVADVAAARRDYLDESGGRYVHVIADGSIGRSGDIAKAVACGADAVMVGSPLARATEAPGRGFHWGAEAAPPHLPRGERVEIEHRRHARGDPVRPLPRRRRHHEPRRRAAPGDGHHRLHRAQGVPAGRGRRPVSGSGGLRLAAAPGRVRRRGPRGQRRDGGRRWSPTAADQGARVVVLPELFLTGYDPRRLDATTGSPSTSTTLGCDPLREVAAAGAWSWSSGPPCAGRRRRRTLSRRWWSTGRRGARVAVRQAAPRAGPEQELLHPGRPRRHDRRRRLELGLSASATTAASPSTPGRGRRRRASAYLSSAAYFVGAEHRRDLDYAARALDNGIYVVFAGLTGPLRRRATFSGGTRGLRPRGPAARPARRPSRGGGRSPTSTPDVVAPTRGREHPVAARPAWHRWGRGPRIEL